MHLGWHEALGRAIKRDHARDDEKGSHQSKRDCVKLRTGGNMPAWSPRSWRKSSSPSPVCTMRNIRALPLSLSPPPVSPPPLCLFTTAHLSTLKAWKCPAEASFLFAGVCPAADGPSVSSFSPSGGCTWAGLLELQGSRALPGPMPSDGAGNCGPSPRHFTGCTDQAGAYRIRMSVKGRTHKALVDTGCNQTTIHQCLFQDEALGTSKRVRTDASDRGLGAVLLLRETKYITIEKECLSIKWAILTLQYYLLGWAFTLWSDHTPLQWLHRMKDTNARITHWYLALQPFRFEVVHRPGAQMAFADFLSRNGWGEWWADWMTPGMSRVMGICGGRGVVHTPESYNV
ncbi:uncharacterized protein LOC127420845 [Myxocyprinus asiaticus]|uniref:uncharacterized protein LOC127420845 n=1 Tax=Myxocyprinus asiaticus TaxID=70543 RepID=UPI0022234651|nr:uncharacterized protein LOC127420845 [Myxocyprinus asiaticus]